MNPTLTEISKATQWKPGEAISDLRPVKTGNSGLKARLRLAPRGEQITPPAAPSASSGDGRGRYVDVANPNAAANTPKQRRNSPVQKLISRGRGGPARSRCLLDGLPIAQHRPRHRQPFEAEAVCNPLLGDAQGLHRALPA
jgi:hypothetical protein